MDVQSVGLCCRENTEGETRELQADFFFVETQLEERERMIWLNKSKNFNNK